MIFWRGRNQKRYPVENDPYFSIGVGYYVQLLIPTNWFFGYQSGPGFLTLAIIPPFALHIDFAKIRHRLTCGLCFGKPSRH